VASGLQVDRWLAEGLLDQVTLGGVAAHAPDAPAEWWIGRAHAGGCGVFPGLEGQLDWLPGPGAGGTGLHAGDGVADGYGPPSLPYLRAVAARHYADGADGVSLFNFTCADGPWPLAALTELGDPGTLSCADKQYVAALWPSDAFPSAADWVSKLRLEPGHVAARYVLHLTDDPAEAAARGRQMTARLTLDVRNLNRLSDLEVRLNGHPLTWTGERYNHYDHGCWAEVLTFAVDAAVLRRGENTLSLHRLATHAGFDGAIEVRKCVLDVSFG
jgi:hypothetical protein